MAYNLAEPFGPLPDPFPMSWHVAAYVWHLGIVLATVMIWALFSGVPALNGRLRRRSAAEPVTPTTPIAMAKRPEPTRRQRSPALSTAAVPPLATASIGAVSLCQLGQFRIAHRRLVVPGLPGDLEGVTIAHVSDLHIGKFLPAGMMARVAAATNAMKADLVVFTGDLIDLLVQDVPAGIEFIRHLDPRGGLVMIEGNHDLFDYPERFEQEVKNAGLPLLLDQSKTIRLRGPGDAAAVSGDHLGRVEVRLGNRPHPPVRAESAIPGGHRRHQQRVGPPRRRPAQARRFPILLAHHPHAFDAAARLGIPLTLAGHTHGGQLMLTRTFRRRLAACSATGQRPVHASGRRRPGSSTTASATGSPSASNAPAEIVHLTLSSRADPPAHGTVRRMPAARPQNSPLLFLGLLPPIVAAPWLASPLSPRAELVLWILLGVQALTLIVARA